MKKLITYTICFVSSILPASAYMADLNSTLKSVTILEEVSEELPVIILEFRGKLVNGQHVRLNWLVRDEEDLDYYEVQKMVQGIWTPIDRVQANGGDMYDYLDFTVTPQMMYRLKAVDLDGSFEYSNTVRIKAKGLARFFSVYPNPFSDAFRIINENNNYSYQIYDSMGNLVADGVSDQDNIESVSVKLKTGVYIIHVIDNTTRVRETIKIRKT